MRLGHELAKRLVPGDIVLFFGDLGAGKTTFIKGMAEELGIEMTIKSPTFAYVNKYPAKKAEVYHYDLYRLNEGDDLSALGFEESIYDEKAINLVEWADRLGDNLPKRFIAVDFGIHDDYRSINIIFKDPRVVSYPEELQNSIITDYFGKWQTPVHVAEHCAQVMNVAMQIADEYIKVGQLINLDLVAASAMLHDMCRVCDFKELLRDGFEEEVTEEKWATWESLREEYKGQHHANIAYEDLKKDGFIETAEVIRVHKGTDLIDEPEALNTLEKKIVHYADKRVKHTEIVSIKERFADGRERYSKFNDEDTVAFYEDVEQATYKLEKDLFAPLNIEPEDIK